MPPAPPRGAAGLLGDHGVTMLRRVTVLASIGSLGAALTSVDLQHLQWLDLRYVVIALACVFSYGLLRTGRTQAAVLTLIWCIGLFLLAMAFVVQGVRTPGLIVLPVLCTLAAWLLGLRSALVLGALSVAVISFFALAEPFGYSPPQMPRNTLAYVIVYIVTIVMAIFVAIASTRGFEGELQRSHLLSQNLQQQVQALRASEERFSALFRANPVPSSTNNPDGRIIDVNDAWVAEYGVRREDAIGKTSVTGRASRGSAHSGCRLLKCRPRMRRIPF